MNKKYLNFSIILIVLSVFDVITTQYALSKYPHLSEGNPIMALVTSSFALFVLVKAFGVMFIVGLYRRIETQSKIASKIGQTAIIIMMLFVVGNNLIQIGSAVSFGFPSPYELESPGRVEEDGSQTYAFIGHNNYNVTEYFTFNTSSNGELEYAATNKLYSDNVVQFAVIDWAHPYRMFVVFKNLDVAYTDTPSGIIYEDGYYSENVWPLTGCSNCNDLHKIGVVTSLNARMSGFVDSSGDLILGEGLNIIKFVRASDYSKITYITITGADYTATTGSNGGGQTFGVTDSISSIRLNNTGYLNVIVSGSLYTTPQCVSCAYTTHISSIVYLGTTKISSSVLDTYSVTNSGTSSAKTAAFYGLMLPTLNSSIVLGSQSIDSIVGNSNVKLRLWNGTAFSDICPSFCATITGLNGLQIYSGYAYIASATENKIYRFPTTVTVSSGTGYIPGTGTGATATPNINYNIKTIQSMYANYYNTSQLLISVNIDADSGFNLLGNNYAINASLNPLSQWYYFDIINPDGVMVKQQAVGKCVDVWAPLNPTGRCTITGLYQFNAPSNGWQGGSWYAKLYESANGGHVALLTTSATWNVYGGNESLNASIIGNGVEPITSISNQETLSQFDWVVGLMGLGVNSITKFLFSLIIIVIMFIVGLWWGNGNIGLALSTIPYTFFTYIEYLPKWVFIIYIIMLIVISKVFR